jgi:twitching motility two-component system response regulator PilG
MGAALKILLVDDTKTLTTLMRVYLMGWSMEFNDARDGETALHLARALKPDLVITDIKMPVMDGFQLCQAIRSDPTLSQTPVILLTQLEDDASRQRGLQAGATAFLTKPVSVERLRGLVARVLNLDGPAA